MTSTHMTRSSKRVTLARLCVATLFFATRAAALNWSYCENFNNRIAIHRLDVVPDPLKMDQRATISLNATLPVDIKETAYITGEAKYFFITVPIPNTSICKYVQCPIRKGNLQTNAETVVDDDYPPGKYQVRVELYNSPNEPLACIQGEIELQHVDHDTGR